MGEIEEEFMVFTKNPLLPAFKDLASFVSSSQPQLPDYYKSETGLFILKTMWAPGLATLMEVEEFVGDLDIGIIEDMVEDKIIRIILKGLITSDKKTIVGMKEFKRLVVLWMNREQQT